MGMYFTLVQNAKSVCQCGILQGAFGTSSVFFFFPFLFFFFLPAVFLGHREEER